MIKTRLAGTAAAFIFGLSAVAGTVMTFAAPASASTTPQTPWAGGSFQPNPYPEPNAFPSLPTNPWAH